MRTSRTGTSSGATGGSVSRIGGEFSFFEPKDQEEALSATGPHGVTFARHAAKFHLSWIIGDGWSRDTRSPDASAMAGLSCGYRFRVEIRGVGRPRRGDDREHRASPRSTTSASPGVAGVRSEGSRSRGSCPDSPGVFHGHGGRAPPRRSGSSPTAWSRGSGSSSRRTCREGEIGGVFSGAGDWVYSDGERPRPGRPASAESVRQSPLVPWDGRAHDPGRLRIWPPTQPGPPARPVPPSTRRAGPSTAAGRVVLADQREPAPDGVVLRGPARGRRPRGGRPGDPGAGRGRGAGDPAHGLRRGFGGQPDQRVGPPRAGRSRGRPLFGSCSRWPSKSAGRPAGPTT